jgi:hypothetical protein
MIHEASDVALLGCVNAAHQAGALGGKLEPHSLQQQQ